LFKKILKETFKKLEIEYEGKKINFKTPWQRVEFNQLIRKATKINLDEIHPIALKKEAANLGIKVEKGEGKAQIADKIYKKFCQSKIWHPTFVIHHPVEKSPLAKTLEKDNKKLASFQLVIGGWLLCCPIRTVCAK